MTRKAAAYHEAGHARVLGLPAGEVTIDSDDPEVLGHATRNWLRLAASALCLVAIAACDRKPEHYYVLCEGEDANGWKLVDTVSDNGYLMACTYQSPDKGEVRTYACRSSGCD